VSRNVTIKVWLENAVQDAEQRGLTELRPLLEALARATSALRTADWNADAGGHAEPAATPDAG
jgi:hypothetical protein